LTLSYPCGILLVEEIGEQVMHREEADNLTLGDAMRYFNDEELNPRDVLLKDFELLLKAHRDYINGLSNSDYREYKRRRNENLKNQK
tara:strand:- start:658 stop:918 length:261 start_codon:yes stop_codon:yes gene_type:complete